MPAFSSKILLTFTLLSGSVVWAQFTTPTAPDCGKYGVVRFTDGSYACERHAAFPWFAVGQGWQTQISMYVAPIPRVNGQIRGALFDLGLGAYSSTACAFGRAINNGAQPLQQGVFNETNFIVLSSSSARLDIQSPVFAFSNGSCSSQLSTALGAGPFWVVIDAPDVETLEAANLQLIYLYSDSSGNQTRQVAVLPVFSELSGPRWVSTFAETPIPLKSGNPSSNDMSFAVTNTSSVPQFVAVFLYDAAGNLIVRKDTPVLAAGFTDGDQVLAGGYYAATFADFFALADTAAATKTGTIDGSIQFLGSESKPIAPLVVRNTGNSVTVLQQAVAQ